MDLMLDACERQTWLRDLNTVSRERAPKAIYELLQKSKISREVSKDLVARKDIHSALNMKLNLLDVATVDISKENYMTLLVHLGIASVRENEARRGHIVRCTSPYFRSEYLNELLKVTLALLFGLSTMDEIYNQQHLLEEFMLTLPASAMSKMISWVKTATTNRILEPQFQGVLVGELHVTSLTMQLSFRHKKMYSTRSFGPIFESRERTRYGFLN